MLLYGPPGLGKTTLAGILANEMRTTLVTTSGPAIERGGDLMGILTNLNDHDVLFIDEIHRLPRVVEELLYPAMEDFAVNFVIERGLHARRIKHRLSRFTLVGATTRPGMLSAPLRERFGIFHHLDFYSEAELTRIVKRSASHPRRADRAAGGGRDRAPIAGHAADRQPAPAPRARLRPGERRRRRSRWPAPTRRSTLEGVDRGAWTGSTAGSSIAIIEHTAAGRWGWRRWRPPSTTRRSRSIEMVEPYLLKIGFVVRTPAGRRVTAGGLRRTSARSSRRRPCPARVSLFE